MKVHLGCGSRRLPDFVHVDARAEVQPDHVATADSLPMFADESVELLYWCHGLEHIQRPQVQSVLSELRRVLIPGGTLRLSLPNIKILAALYVSGQVLLERIVGPIHGRQDYPDNTHYCSYDWLSLVQTLTTASFSNITPYDPYAVNPAGYDDYSYAKIDGQLISLNVEATK